MPARESRLIGRAIELDVVSGFLARISDGPGIMLIEGEPGIGKTALLQASLDVVRSRPVRVLASRPSESEAALPFTALKDLLDEVVDDHLPSLPDPQRAALETALLRAAGTSGSADHQTVSYAVLAVLGGLCLERPALIVVDDLQWLDPSSARVLRFVLRRIGEAPLAAVASVRSGERPTPDPIRGLPEDRVRRLSVGPMAPGEIGSLLQARFDMHLSGPVRAEFHRATGGNPFYALEIARALKRTGRSPAAARPLPVSEELGDVVADRLAGLSPDAREALLVVAALGRPRVSLVRAAIGDRARADAGLAAAEDAEVIEVDGDAIHASHPLLASVVYSAASPRERRSIHRALATTVTEPEEQAQHLALATVGPDEEVAAALTDAARRSNRRGAPDAAAHLCELAVRLTPPDSRRDVWDRMVEAAQHHFAAGATVRAREILERVVEEAPRGPLRAEALRRLAEVRRRDHFPTAVQLLTEALDDVEDDTATRAAIERDFTFPLITSGDPLGGLAHARTALELATSIGDRATMSQAMASVAAAEFITGNGMNTELLEAAVELEGSIEDVSIETYPRLILAAILLRDDRIDEARDVCASLHRMLVDHGNESALPFLMYVMSEIEYWAGDVARADAYATAGYEAAVRSSQRAPHILYARAMARALLGDVEVARSSAEEGLRQSEDMGAVVGMVLNRSALGFIELSLGNPAGTDHYLGRLADMIRMLNLNREGAGARFLPDEIEALISLGDMERARALIDQLEAGAIELDRRWALAASARCRALLLAASGDVEGAVRAAERGLIHHERLGQPLELGRTLLVLGTIQRRARRKRAARDALQRALDVFRDLGSPLWERRTVAELSRVAGKPALGSELTPTEERVADLVASGMTNREVADELFMSVHTLEGTISRIFRKLGVRSRTELAARRSRD